MSDGGTKNDRLLIDAVALERRVALIRDDRLTRLWIDRGGPARFDVHLGRVRKVLPEMVAAMVALDGMDDGLLQLDRYPEPLHEGQWVLVQIARLGFDDKGVKLTGKIAIEGLGMILRPGGKVIELPRKLKDDGRRAELAAYLKTLQTDDDGLMLRSAALDWSPEMLGGEYRLLRAQWQKALGALADPTKPVLVSKAQSDVDQIIERHLMAGGACVVDGTDAFVELRGMLKARGVSDAHLARHTGTRILFDDQDVEGEVADALNPRVDLAGGGWIAIDQATALCVIDVNAGGADAGRDSATRALDVNLRAAREIVHQVRLRNIGGLIVIDPLRMKTRADRDRFETVIKDAFGSELDGAVQLGGFTRLGLYEFSRQRAGESLEAMTVQRPVNPRLNDVSALNAVLRGIVAHCRNGMGSSVSVLVAPGMVQRLAARNDTRQILIREFGTMPEILADQDLEQDAFRLEKK